MFCGTHVFYKFVILRIQTTYCIGRLYNGDNQPISMTIKQDYSQNNHKSMDELGHCNECAPTIYKYLTIIRQRRSE